jgi:hypothetical protein
MTRDRTKPHTFVLEAVDLDLWCPILAAKIEVLDLAVLRDILGEATEDDPELRKHYYDLDAADLTAIKRHFGVGLDASALGSPQTRVGLFQLARQNSPPYLIHGGYELPLLLDGRKKLAKMYHEYPPMTFYGEEQFDRWVNEGVLHKEVDVEPFDAPMKGFEGVRTAYYTPKGEEWRIPAMKLVQHASGRSGGWNEHFERLEGMLYGYEDWQNDWWIKNGLKGGGFGGLAFCCPVSAAGLAWIAAAGFRALPPIDRPALPLLAVFGDEEVGHLRNFMLQDDDSVALVRFNVPGKALIDIIDIREGGPWLFPADRIPELNRHLLRNVTIIDERNIV